MNNSLKFKSLFSFIAIVIVLLTSGSTQEAHAQFGLFDTVWTMNGLAESYFIKLSPNDSLMTIHTAEKPPSPGKYIPRCRLFNTISKEVIWDTTNIFLSYILNDIQTILSFDSSKIILRNLFTLQPVSEIIYTDPPLNGCTMIWNGLSEVDTSIYYSGYCGATAIKGISYKVNYRTGQVKETSHILPYFAMTISEDGQYVAGVYYTGGTASNVPYNEVIEVRKISDYSVVFREEKYYSDWKPSFTPYYWVSDYGLKFSKDNKFLVLHKQLSKFKVYDLNIKKEIYLSPLFNGSYEEKCFTKDSKGLFYIKKTYKDGFNVDSITYHLLNLETLRTQNFAFPENKQQCFLEKQSSILLLDDQYILGSYFSAIVEKKEYKYIADIALVKLNFNITSVPNVDDLIHGILFPNPANNTINLSIELNTHTQLNYSIYSGTGQIIKLLLDEFTKPGTITKSFDVSGLPTGTYFLRITGERFSQTYKVIINR